MANVELAKAFVTIIPSMQGAQQTIADELTSGFGKSSDKVGGKIGADLGGKIGKQASAALAKFAAPAAIAAGVTAIGKGAFDIGERWDGVFDRIKVGTGATGEALEALDQSAKNVAANVPNSIEDVGQTLADLNTRTGATGETLEGLSTRFLQLDEIGQGLDVNAATGAFNAWNIGAEDMGDALDDLFLVSQNTGAGMSSLVSTLSANASSLQSLGFSFQDSAAMAGLFDKAGLNASSMMGKLSKAATQLAKDGKDPAEAFKQSVSEIDAFIKKGDQAAAIDLASSLFGTKGASQFVQALQSGSMNVEELSSLLAESNGDIAANADATKSFSQSADELKNKLAVAFEPLGSAVFTGASVVIAGICDGVDFLGSALGDLKTNLQENENVMEALGAAGEIVSLVGEAGAAAFGLMVSAAKPLQPIISHLGGVLSGAFNNAVILIGGTLRTAANAMKFFRDLFTGKISFPKITLPHLSIKPDGWGPGDLLKGKIPNISVDFYAKGGYMDKPTRIPIGGEAGAEGIVPLQGPHMYPMADAIAERIKSGNAGATTNIYINGVQVDDKTETGRFAKQLTNKLRQMNRGAHVYG